MPENEHLAGKRRTTVKFEDSVSAKGVILRYNSKPGSGLFHNPLINFYNAHALLW